MTVASNQPSGPMIPRCLTGVRGGGASKIISGEELPVSLELFVGDAQPR